MVWNIHQMDVKTTFLNGTIDEEVYIEQPEGFQINNKDTCLQTQEIPIWFKASS